MIHLDSVAINVSGFTLSPSNSRQVLHVKCPILMLWNSIGCGIICITINCFRSIREKFPFVDGDRMAIWGWVGCFFISFKA